jgi:hypothetical protein
MNILLYVFNLIIEYYMIMFGKNEKIDSLFGQISEAIKEEINFQKNLKEIHSKIDSVYNISNLNNTLTKI